MDAARISAADHTSPHVAARAVDRRLVSHDLPPRNHHRLDGLRNRHLLIVRRRIGLDRNCHRRIGLRRLSGLPVEIHSSASAQSFEVCEVIRISLGRAARIRNANARRFQTDQRKTHRHAVIVIGLDRR